MEGRTRRGIFVNWWRQACGRGGEAFTKQEIIVTVPVRLRHGEVAVRATGEMGKVRGRDQASGHRRRGRFFEGEERRDEIVVGESVVVQRGGRVHEVGPRLDAAHGPGGAVVGARGLLGRVEGAEPSPLLRLGVADLGGVPAPRAAADAAVARLVGVGSGWVFDGAFVGGGGGGGAAF